jgi:outer membrane protein
LIQRLNSMKNTQNSLTAIQSSANHRKLLNASLLATALACSGIAHAEVDALVREALALAEAGQSQQAFNMLEPHEERRAGDPDFDTVMGIAANGSAQYTRAVFALERVLAVQPGNARARAELGRALFAVGDNNGARQAINEAKASGAAPAAAVSTMNQLLQAIDRADEAARSTVRTYVDFGLGHDTNANSGPASANVAVPSFGNLVFTLNPTGVKTAASFWNASAGVSGRYVLDPRWSLIGNLNASLRKHAGSADVFNNDSIALNAGTSYRHEQMEYSLALALDTTRSNGTRARSQAGLVGEWTYRLDNFRQLSSYLQWSRLSYPAPQDARNSTRTVLGSNYAHTFRNDMVVFGGGYIGTERPHLGGIDHVGHRLWGIRTGIQQPLTESISWFASFGYEDRKFGGTDPTFLVTRSDQQSNLNVGLNWIPAKLWRVTPQIALANTSSNIVLNDFSKRVVSVTGKREF